MGVETGENKRVTRAREVKEKAQRKAAEKKAKKQRKKEERWAKDGVNVAFIKGEQRRDNRRLLATRVLSDVREVAAAIPMHDDDVEWCYHGN